MKAPVFLVILALGSTIVAAPAAQSQWRRLDSPNFIVIGEVGGGELRDIAVKFEGFREVLGRVLNEGVTTSPVPTVVVVFRGDATFKPFMPMYKGKRVEVGGLFVPRRDVNHIAMVSDPDPRRLRVVFHEYAHLLINNTGQTVPIWMSEGIAEYYSTFELARGGRDAIIGGLIDDHLEILNTYTPLKLPELLGVDHKSPLYNEGTRRSVFYAQSWALMHMLLRSEKNRAPQIAAYLTALAEGQAPMAAWQQAFGPEDLGRALENYVRQHAYTATRYKFTDRLAAFEAQAVPIPPADLDAYLADLLVQENALDDAATRLAGVEKRDPQNARARIVRAALANDKGDFAAAEKFSRSVGNVDDWFLNYRAGVEFVSALEGRQADALPADLAVARQYFERAGAGGHEFANALARLASLEAASPSGPTKETRALLERARSIAPGRHEYGLLLAQVLAQLSEFDAARGLLGPLMSPRTPENIREAARKLMGTVVTIQSENARRGSGAPPVTSPRATPSAIGRDEPLARPVYREMKEGEQRLEGNLEQIECVAGKGVTFRVKTPSESILVTSPDLKSVDFITYRNDLGDTIKCGQLTPPLPVYVTFRPGQTAGSRIAVALEFLRK